MAGPAVQLDWPEEELATTRLDDSEPFQTLDALDAADATQQLELPAHSVWEDDGPKTEAQAPLEEFPREGVTSTQKMSIAVVALLLVGAGAYVLLRGPELAVLKLDVTPADAVVTLDGQRLATASPYVIEGLDADKQHSVQVSKDGFTVWSTQVQLQAGETMTLPPVALDPEKHETGFAIDSAPSGAKVLVDGQDRGLTTPARVIDLSPGTHRIEVVGGESFAPWTTQVHVADRQVVELAPAALASRPVPAADASRDEVASATRVDSDEVARQPARRTKLSARERRAAARRAKAQAAATRAANRKSSPRVASAATAPAAPAAARGGTGTLRINTQPWSNVFVDGRLVGNTPQMGLQLSAGRHRLTLVNQELGIRKLVEVDVPAGQTVTKIVKLAPGN